MIVGILGCGAIANIITNFASEGKLGVEIKYFYDRDMERAENLASQVDGRVVLDLKDMLSHVDLVIEAASPKAVEETVPIILKEGKDVIVMSVGGLLNPETRLKLEKLAKKKQL